MAGDAPFGSTHGGIPDPPRGQLRELLSAVPALIMQVDRAGRVVYINQVFDGMEASAILSSQAVNWATPASRPAMLTALARVMAVPTTVDLEVEGNGPGGSVRQYLLRLRGVWQSERCNGAYIVATDQTERVEAQRALRESEERLSRAAREESIGRLAGGVAHDFNSLLTAILGYAELGLTHGDEPERVIQALERIREAGRRGATLTGQLLAYARHQPAALRPVHPGRLVERVARLIAPLLANRIELRVSCDPTTPAMQADASMIEQVLVNLAVNGCDAMPDGGVLVVNVRPVTLAIADVVDHHGVAPGAFVRLEVRDSGDGLAPGVQEHLFEPFFTTKPVGKGTGLGLASSQGLVRQHHGIIRVRSDAGRGTTVWVDIPATTVAADEGDSSLQPAVPGAGETILLVEDEGLIRDMVASALQTLGYRVIPAIDGEDALMQWQAASAPIDLLVTDLLMPRLGGHALAERLRRRHPELRVLFMSGYSGEDDHYDDGTLADFLAKPFTTAQLASSIRALLVR